MEYPLLVYLVFLIGATLFSILVNRLLLRFSSNLGTRKNEDLIRWTSETKPSVGGLSFYILFLISVVVLALVTTDADTSFDDQMLGLFTATTLGFLIGLADDAYNTKPVLKFLGQFTCANILIATDLYIEITPSLMLNYFFTIMWVVGIMNSINMLDNMDGITGSIAASIIGSVILVVALSTTGFNDYLIILIGVVAALAGFLVYNWYPAKIYMGDTGSQFLGIFLAAISIKFLWVYKEPTEEYFQLKQFILPLLAFIVPIIDTTTVFVRRLARGQSPFVGGRDHTTHHLAFNGIRDDKVALLLLCVSLFSLVIIFFIYPLLEDWQYNYSLAVIGYFLVLLIIAQIVYERGKKRKKEMENVGA